MLFLVGLGFLVTLRSINVFVFDWEAFSLINSWCLRKKVKLACGLQSFSPNVIMQVLLSAAVIVLVPVQ